MCYLQEHEAWLEEPQELATFDVSKTDPLLEDTKDSKNPDLSSGDRSVKGGTAGYKEGKRSIDVNDEQKAAHKLDKLNEV